MFWLVFFTEAFAFNVYFAFDKANASSGSNVSTCITITTDNIQMVRKVLSVIAGYAFFVATTLALFKITGQAPHGNATTTFMILATIYCAVFSFVSGLIVQLIGKTNNLTLNYILAFIIAGLATFSLLKSDGSHWTQIVAITIFAPVSVLGGMFYIKRQHK